MEKRKQLIICIIVYICYVSITLLSNIFMHFDIGKLYFLTGGQNQ